METRIPTVIYEEPSNPFDLGLWIDFRERMEREVLLHPDWSDAKSALVSAMNHIELIQNHSSKVAEKLAA